MIIYVVYLNFEIKATHLFLWWRFPSRAAWYEEAWIQHSTATQRPWMMLPQATPTYALIGCSTKLLPLQMLLAGPAMYNYKHVNIENHAHLCSEWL